MTHLLTTRSSALVLSILVLAPPAESFDPVRDADRYMHEVSASCPQTYTMPREPGWPIGDKAKNTIPVLDATFDSSPVVADAIRKRARAVGALWSPDGPMATAVLVGPAHVLTVSHKISSKRAFEGLVFVTDWSMTYGPDGAAVSTGPYVRCFPLNPSDLLSSPAGHLDYSLVGITPDLDVNRESTILPGHKDVGISPLSASANAEALRAGDAVYLIGSHPDGKADVPDFPNTQEYYATSRPEGLVQVVGGKVYAFRRWIKDLGVSMNIDYAIYSIPGLSGAAIFNSRHEWIGLHQRDLNRAKCDAFTPWHPYISEYYHDKYSSMDVLSVWRNQCVGGVVQRDVSNDDYARIKELPRQGTPLADIAQDIVSRRGTEWACAHVRSLVAILPREDGYICDHAKARDPAALMYRGAGDVSSR